jgi:hypothetical protein
VIVLETRQSVENYTKSHHRCIFLAGDDIDPDFMDTFNSVADNLSDRIPFAICSNGESVSFLSRKDFPFHCLFRAGGNAVLDFPLSSTVEPGDLKSWILDRLEPRFHLLSEAPLRDLSVAASPRFALLHQFLVAFGQPST